MRVIPVVDVRAGTVVRAVGGRRDEYRPIVTPLAPGTSDPVAVAKGLLQLYPFADFYIADLDGIEGRGRDLDLPRRIAQALPGVRLWLDNGSACADEVGELMGVARLTMVVGSESLADMAEYARMRERFAGRIALSLDFREAEYLGHERLLDDPGLWPCEVIVMTLAAVGAEAGPDLARVADIGRRASAVGGRTILAAGGIRDVADLKAAAAAGASGALVATALHASCITATDLAILGCSTT
jgi:phosphoribosylformimino-5-aminoimidazole carboxamide ribotide isomerase